jgi:hypothetical protein
MVDVFIIEIALSDGVCVFLHKRRVLLHHVRLRMRRE